MSVERVLDPRALLVAAVIGALIFWFVWRQPAWRGAITGALIQMGVRLAAVS